jgi:hypothetical protein
MDIARPVFNIYHNKLAIAVDWYVQEAPSSGSHYGAVGSSGSAGSAAVGEGALTPIVEPSQRFGKAFIFTVFPQLNDC